LNKNKKLFLYSLIIFGIYTFLIYLLGYFKIGLLSDDYLNFYDATHSTFYEKITGHLPFTNVFHIRPIYYLSLEKSIAVHDWLGFAFDNFVWYRIQNLVLLLCNSLLAGYIVLHITRRMTLSIISLISVILFSNNVNNICWTAARIDLICILFYLASLYFALQYSDNKNKLNFTLTVVSFLAALLTKELAITLPFTVLLMLYFIKGKENLNKSQTAIITLFSILAVYFIYRFIILGNSVMDIATLYQESPLSGAPGVFARGLISISIPMDFLALNYALRSDNKIIILYLFALYGALIYLMWVMAKIDIYKYAVQIIILMILLLTPHAIVGYMRPQMAMLPFIILTIHLLWIYSTQRKFNTYLKKNVLRGFYAVVFIFWGYWSAENIQNWLISYEKSRINVENLIKVSPEPNKQTVIIGNPGRFMQTLMFDKMTGAYNFWKEKQFTVKDTINDIIQTAAITESSIGAKLEYKMIDSTEFEIKTDAPRHFFYIEGFNYDRTRMGFENNDISVAFLEFNNVDKPIRMRLKILSPNVSCYLADNLNFIKIY
jgi:hypothetical protein